MDGVEAIGVWMMAWSSFAGERASELQAVGREGPRSKDRRGRARSAAVGMLGPMPLLCRGGGTTLSNVSAGGVRTQDRAVPRWSTHRMAPPRQREVQPVDRCAPPVSCTALHRAAGRPHPSPARPPAAALPLVARRQVDSCVEPGAWHVLSCESRCPPALPCSALPFPPLGLCRLKPPASRQTYDGQRRWLHIVVVTGSHRESALPDGSRVRTPGQSHCGARPPLHRVAEICLRPRQRSDRRRPLAMSRRKVA